MSKTLEKLFEELGLNKKNGLIRSNERLPDYPSRIKIPLKTINYDAIFDLDGKPLIIFKEFDSTFIKVKKEISSLHRAVWNFNETPVLFVILKDEFQIYNGFLFDRDDHGPLKTLVDIRKVKEEFSYENLASGEYWKENEKIFSGDKRVHDYLIKNLRAARKILFDKGLDFKIINNLIGRLIFSRYLIDRNFLQENFFKEEYGLEFTELILSKDKLYDYFGYLRERFNGDMFPLRPNEKNKVQKSHLSVLNKLFLGNEIITGQSVLFDVYDFSIIPIELISSIYEMFLNEDEKRSKKAYYTPPFLVDYILNQTLSKKLEKTDDSNIKILDPACGSGIFLVESLRRLIKKEMEIKGRKLSNKELENVLLNNIFGIDIDENAIYISIFSIYLTLLDYQEFEDINNLDFKFPELMGVNFIKSDFFETKNGLFKNLLNKFDLVLGNPPWIKGIAGRESLYELYCLENDIPLAENQITQAFLVRAKDFCNPDANVALIVNSRILYNSKGKYEEFRKYFLKNFIIKMILELAPLRKQVFKDASGPGVIIIYKMNNNEGIEENEIEYVSLKPSKLYKLFKCLSIEKYDRKFIPQNYFIDNDWLWKIALYGNVNDFLLLKKLKKNENTIKKVINDNKHLDSGVGVFVGKKGKYDSSNFKDTFFLDIKNHKKIIQRYFINTNIDSKWPFYSVVRIDPNLYNPPYVIIKHSPEQKHFRTVAAFSDQKMIFKKGVMAIKGDEQSKKLLMNFLGLINSKLFTYYVFSTSSALGVERDAMAKEEILSFPFIEDTIISQKSEELGDLYKTLYTQEQDKELIQQIEALEQHLDEYIFNLYKLNNTERDLVNYTLDISIPLYNWKDTPFKNPTKEELENYAEIFESYFKKRLKNSKYFSVEIYQTNYFIAMNFMITTKKNTKPKFSDNKDIDVILDKLGNLSFEEISNNLYNIKDIKGFEKSSFYIIKPKEYKNWHQSIARMDLNEFVNAIITRDAIEYGVNYGT